MPSIEYFRTASPIHRVRIETGGFTILPVSEARSDMENFQQVARQAALYSGDDFRATPHPGDQGVDEVFFERLTSSIG